VNAICQDILGVLGAAEKVLYTKQEVTIEIHLYEENFVMNYHILLKKYSNILYNGTINLLQINTSHLKY